MNFDTWMVIVAGIILAISLAMNTILLFARKKKKEEPPPELPPLPRDPQELHFQKEPPASYPANMLDPDIFKAIKIDIDQKEKRMSQIEKEVAELKKEYDLLDIQLMKEKELWGRLK
jgi:hypothetical protein